jgi:hypothetical protein
MKRELWLVSLLTLGPLIQSAPAAAEPAKEQDPLGPSVIRMPVLERRAERGILTPVPIELTLPDRLPARRVLAHYKIWGSKDWTSLELNRLGKRWKGAIPCLEVSTITGNISYYIRVHDAEGAVIAYSGSRHQPYQVKIVRDEGPQAELGRCPDPADCPPGLLGCPSEKVERIPCRSDADCEGELSCGWDGYCEADTRAHHWFGVGVEFGLGVVSGTGACSVPAQENQGYACYRESDAQTYTGVPLYTNEPLAIGHAPIRVWVSYDWLLAYQSTIGARFGYALWGGGPTPKGGAAFMPFSAELRASHWFGDDPFREANFRPYVFLGGGYAMYDVRVSVRVRENFQAPQQQGGNDLEQTLDVWRRAGDAFVGIGAGADFSLAAKSAFSVEIRMAEALPFQAFLVTTSIGVRFGK